MAIISIEKLLRLVRDHTDWESNGWESPDLVLDILLSGCSDQNDPLVSTSLAGKTISYEAHNTTVNLDFDDKGYLTSIQLV